MSKEPSIQHDLSEAELQSCVWRVSSGWRKDGTARPTRDSARPDTKNDNMEYIGIDKYAEKQIDTPWYSEGSYNIGNKV